MKIPSWLKSAVVAAVVKVAQDPAIRAKIKAALTRKPKDPVK